MGSYVISVSAGKGCYRHIQISKSATLFKLHKAILHAFDFEDDHAHAFFMDNHYWSNAAAFFSMKMRGEEQLTKSHRLDKLNLSPGDSFKYLFDFGAEWRFQCKVLRTADEDLAIPCILRSVGKSPAQYPQPAPEENPLDMPMELLSKQQRESLYAVLPLRRTEIALLRRYMEAAAQLYGLISAEKLLEIYQADNPPVDPAAFLLLSALVDCEENSYVFITRHDMPQGTPEADLKASELVADYLLVEHPEESLRELRRQQRGKQYKVLPKAEFLRYADPDYSPDTPARRAMLKYLRRRQRSLSMPAEVFCKGIQDLAVVDAPLREVVSIVESEGLVFNRSWDIGEFAELYQDLSYTTYKHSHRGFSPEELFAMSPQGKKQVQPLSLGGQLSLFEELPQNQKLTVTGNSSRNGPCPCGSGRKYKNCCGK